MDWKNQQKRREEFVGNVRRVRRWVFLKWILMLLVLIPALYYIVKFVGE